jgi:hypothetical protein
MTLISKFATAASLAALLCLSAPAHADGKTKKARKAKVSTKAKAKSKAKTTKLPKAKDYDFMADNIDGDRPLPNHDRILGMGDAKHGSLIRLRQHFIGEIIQTADRL